MKKYYSFINFFLITAPLTPLYAQDSSDPLIVEGEINFALDSSDASLQRIQELPGGGSIITPEQWAGRTIAPEDIFQFDPGVYARSRGVGNDTRISVRGSGLQRRFGDRGLSLLLDGIPANDADGSFYFRTIDPFSIDHIEVYRGANGLAHGGNQLGGAINIVQKNGLNTPGTKIQGEWGRHDTYRSHISHGGSNELLDWFIGYSYAESDGYRERNQWRTHHLTANLGYHWSESATTRFYFLYSDSDAALTGSLTPEEFATNPRQAQPGRPDDVDRDLSTIHFGQRTDWQTQQGEWSFYTNYQYLDFDHLINRSRFGFDRFIDYDSDEFQIGFKGKHHYEWFSLDHTFRIHTAANYGRSEENGFTTQFGPRRVLDIERNNIASNYNIYIENETEFLNDHHLFVGLGYSHSRRKVDIQSGDQTGERSGTLRDEGIVYRLGYLYNVNESLQLFTNYSQSFEGSPFSEVGVSLDPAFPALDPQLARTFEIGTRFANDWASGELTFYHSDVKDEFIDVELPGGFTSTTTNLDSTHQGIEASLNLDLTKIAGWEKGFSLFLDQSYQLNDFEIDEGPDRGNRLPGVSTHVYSGRLRLEDIDEKWKVQLSAEWLPDGFVVDNANTITTDGFIQWKLYAEYKLSDSLSLYGGVDNLFDKSFVNSVTINPSSSSFINPGNGRAGYIGFKASF